jgi:hypothetical protein
MLGSLRDGFRSLRFNWGLVVIVLVTNLALALVLAVPLAFQLDAELAHKGAASAGTVSATPEPRWCGPWSTRSARS